MVLAVWALAVHPAAAAAGGPATGAGVIRLAAAAFDPLLDGEPAADSLAPGPVLRPGAGPDPLRLIQFADRIGPAERRALVGRGVEILGYVPDRALLVRLPADRGDSILRSFPGRRWHGRLRESYKLSADLARRLRAAGGTQAPLRVDVLLHDAAAAPALTAALEAALGGPRVELVRRRAPARLVVELPDEDREAWVAALVRDPAVLYVSAQQPLVLHNDNAAWIGQAYDRVNGPGEALAPDPKPYPLSASIWAHGLTGAGQVVAVADTGLEHELCQFFDPAHPVVPQTVAPPQALALDPLHRKILAYNAPAPLGLAHDDSFRHGTHVAGSLTGDDRANTAGALPGHDSGDGMAPAAKLVFEDVSGNVSGSCSTSITIASVADLLEQEYSAGARISSNSWGSQPVGEYEVASYELDSTGQSLQDMLVLFSAGNDGAAGLGGFATCKNCLTVGACENYDSGFGDAFGILDPENMTVFSSRGPTADGRTKPDVVAPGYFVYSPRLPVEYFADETDAACDLADPGVCFPSFGGCYVTDLDATCHVDRLLGTSTSTPIVAGLATLARQYLTDGFYPGGQPTAANAFSPSAALLKAMLINGARNLGGRLYQRGNIPVDFGPLADAPSGVQGWGRVVLDDVLYFPGDARQLQLVDLPASAGLATGESAGASFAVTSAAEPLKLTLVWTDEPGLPLAFGALVNDLDLELTAPDGSLYRGNRWGSDDPDVAGDRESTPDPQDADTVNNVEGILVRAPQPGVWQWRIVGSSVPGGAGGPSQGAALVTTGAVGACTSAAPPAHARVTSLGATAIGLEWDPVAGALGYEVLRNQTSCGTPLAADSIFSRDASTTSLLDATVVPGSVYNYSVRAVVSLDGCRTSEGACVSAVAVDAAVPPPTPGGPDGAPLRVAKGPTALRLDLTWDATTCPAEGYHLLHGPLSGVAAAEVGGAACSLGSSGSFSWIGVPAGDTWFLVVGDSAGQVEGSWGPGAGGAPRGPGVSGRCGMLVRIDAPACAQAQGIGNVQGR